MVNSFMGALQKKYDVSKLSTPALAITPHLYCRFKNVKKLRYCHDLSHQNSYNSYFLCLRNHIYKLKIFNFEVPTVMADMEKGAATRTLSAEIYENLGKF